MWKGMVKVDGEKEGRIQTMREVAPTKHLIGAPNINKFNLKNGVTLYTFKLNKVGSY